MGKLKDLVFRTTIVFAFGIIGLWITVELSTPQVVNGPPTAEARLAAEYSRIAIGFGIGLVIGIIALVVYDWTKKRKANPV